MILSAKSLANRQSTINSLVMLFVFGVLAFFICLMSANSYAQPQVSTTDAANQLPTTTSHIMSQTGTQPQNTPTNLPALAKPAPSELDKANQELLTKNAKLEQDINTLQTQINVLIAERNNQLFMYGAMISLIAVLVGFIAAWILLGRKQNW